MAHILIAEDDASLRLFLRSALERAGHEVQDCADGEAALQAFRAGAPCDLLLTDIVMPGLDGIELSREAGRLRPALKTIFITGFTGAVQEVSENRKVITKPFHLNDLIAEVGRILAA